MSLSIFTSPIPDVFSSSSKLISERLSMNDITPRGQVVRFDLDDYLRGNPLEQIEVLGKMLEYGLINVDEAREEMDLAPRGNEANAT